MLVEALGICKSPELASTINRGPLCPLRSHFAFSLVSERSERAAEAAREAKRLVENIEYPTRTKHMRRASFIHSTSAPSTYVGVK